MTTEPTEADLQFLQRKVQRLLGRCLVRLQQYEHLIKAIVAHHEIAGPAHALDSIRTQRVVETASKTLGTLVGRLLGSAVVLNQLDTPGEMTANSPENVASIGLRLQLSLTTEDYARTESELRDLVQLRNNLVHHFIEQHNLWSLDGCRSAHDALVVANSSVDQHFNRLLGWAKSLEQARKLAAEFVQSDAFHELMVKEIAPVGTVHWALSGIVSALREAAAELAVDGWTPVASAGRWIAERYPEQIPAKYGCRRWRQVVHESRLFELRYREVAGQRAAWYRELVGGAN